MQFLAQTAQTLGISLTDQEMQKFEEYYRQLIAAKGRAGLTSVTDYQGVQRRHFGESLAIAAALYRLRLLTPGQGRDVLDLGAGAGFPGVPIRIIHPALRLTLVEATRKKASFLQHLVAHLGLAHVTVVPERAETLGRDPAHREKYDLVLARAVAPLAVLVELALPFLRIGGSLAAPKGSRARQELDDAARAIELCGGRVLSAEPLPSPALSPTLVLVEKAQPTPAGYPRRPGIPAKRPLR